MIDLPNPRMLATLLSKQIRSSPFVPIAVCLLTTLGALAFAGSNSKSVSDIILLILTLVVQMALWTVPAFLSSFFPLQLLKPGTNDIRGMLRGLSIVFSIAPAVGLVFQIHLLVGVGLIVLSGLAAIYNFLIAISASKNAMRMMASNPPDHLVHAVGERHHAYQTNQWIPIFDKLPEKFYIVTRTADYCEGLIATSCPVFLAANTRALEMLSSAGAKSVIYLSNSGANVDLFRFPDMKHIFINHGESDKIVNQNRQLLAYDHLFLAGKLAADRLETAGLPLRDKQVIYVGRPQTELSLQKKLTDTRLLKLLYAPTWEGMVESANYSSVTPDGLEMLEHLLKNPNISLEVKFHPLTGSKKKNTAKIHRKMQSLCEKRGIKIHPPSTPIADLMNWSDGMICDISSVMNDYLYTEKEIVLTAFNKMSAAEFSAKFPSSKACHILRKPDQISDVLTACANPNPDIETARVRLLEYSLSISKGSSFARFQAALNNL